MSVLPDTRKDWEVANKELDIPIGPLSSGHAFQSGSKFCQEDFLRLRILHETSNAAQLYLTTHLSRPSVESMTRNFNKSPDIQVLRQLLPTWKKIEKWTYQDSRKAGQFAVALEHLSIVATSAKKYDPDKEPPSSRIINSPRIRTSVVNPTKSKTSITDDLSRLRIRPETPLNKSARSANEWDDSPYPPSASTAPTVPSPMNQDLQSAVDNYKREMFEITGDEQTVNASLVALIIPVASMLRSRGRVRLDRKPFQVLKKNPTDGTALYEAQVDGVIMDTHCKDVQAFMEVKRNLRGRKKEVRMQEGAQMAAFVYSKGRTTKASSKQWMVSMNGFEGYITVATYDKHYVDFLYDEPLNGNTGFMTMQEYGPFDLRCCQSKETHGLESFLKAIAVLMGL